MSEINLSALIGNLQAERDRLAARLDEVEAEKNTIRSEAFDCDRIFGERDQKSQEGS